MKAKAAGEASHPTTVSPRLIEVLGKFLVSDHYRILAELIKNAYDADAFAFEIEYDRANSRLIFRDNGVGISAEDITRAWFRVATEKKSESTTSKEQGRVVSGSMGIGRWALMALGDGVTLETGTSEATWRRLSYSMADFQGIDELTDVEFTSKQIPVPPDAIPSPKGIRRGLILRVAGVEKWAMTETLKVRLANLFEPFHEPKFEIRLVTSSGRENLREKTSERPPMPLRLEGVVESDAKIVYKITPYKPYYQGKKSNLKPSWKFEELGDYHHIIGATLTLDFFVSSKSARPGGNWWVIPFGSEPPKQTRGVRIYRDGVRVHPYGEPDDDWLDTLPAQVARGSLGRLPRKAQLDGWISISRTGNTELLDTANRDGLLHNAAFEELVVFGTGALAKIAEVRQQLEPVGEVPHDDSKQDIVWEDPKAAQRHSTALKKVAEKQPPEDKAVIDEAADYVEAVAAGLEAVALYRERLTIGNLAGLILHDIGITLNETQKIVDAAGKDPGNKKAVSELIELSEDLFPQLLGGYELLSGSSRFGGFRKSRFVLKELTDSLIERFSRAVGRKVNYETEGLSGIKLHMRSADMWSILANLIHNGATASQYKQANDQDLPEPRRIRLDAKVKDGSLLLTYSDNGPGLPSDRDPDWIWVPYNSTRRRGGSGLGLWVVRQIALSYGGSVSAANGGIGKGGVTMKFVLNEVEDATR